MKKLIWFTHTNIDTRKINSGNDSKVTIDLTKYIDIFKKNEIWKKSKIRVEYADDYDKQDLEKISSIVINLHSEGSPYSNAHSYEAIINKYIDKDLIETSKITTSGIGDASQIAVIEILYNSENKIIDNLTHEEEKDLDNIFERKLSSENIHSWREMRKLKSIIVEFMQFLMFNLHLNFLSTNYSFSFTEKPLQTGFTIQTDTNSFYYETDRIDFLSHYIFYDVDQDVLDKIMKKTAEFWHKDIPTIHFFLDTLKGTYITINNFSKLVFTLESFFSERTSNDFMSLTVPLLLGENINSMKKIREILLKAFTVRNNYVHGKEIINMQSKVSKNDEKTVTEIFYELKNIIIYLLSFYIKNDLFLKRTNEKINHELIFHKLPKGINY